MRAPAHDDVLWAASELEQAAEGGGSARRRREREPLRKVAAWLRELAQRTELVPMRRSQLSAQALAGVTLATLDELLRAASVVRLEWIPAASDGRICVVATCSDGRASSSGSLLDTLRLLAAGASYEDESDEC